MRHLLVLATVALIALGSAFAQAAKPSADELIARGLELRRVSKPEEALEAFRRAHALAPSPRTSGQMGLVEASLEHWIGAETFLNASLAARDDAWVRKNRVVLAQALKVVQDHIGELVITGPAGTTVAIDGNPVGTLPDVQPVRHAEGNVAVTTNGAGFKAFSKTVTIASGARVSMAIVFDPVEQRPALALAAPAPLPPTAPAFTFEDQRRPTWKTAAGTGLVTAGAGLLAWGIAWIAVDGNDHCETVGPDCTTVYDTKMPGWILAASGAAAAAGGTLLLLSGRPDHGDSTVTLAGTPSSVSLTGRF
jgi:hypothetical protein